MLNQALRIYGTTVLLHLKSYGQSKNGDLNSHLSTTVAMVRIEHVSDFIYPLHLFKVSCMLNGNLACNVQLRAGRNGSITMASVIKCLLADFM